MPETGNKSILHAAAYDPSLDQHLAGTASLFIEAGSDSLTAALTGSSPGQLLALEQFRFGRGSAPAKLAESFEEAREASLFLANEKFAQVVCGISYKAPLLVPAAFAGKDNEAALYYFCHDRHAGELLFSDTVGVTGAKLLYAIPELIYGLLNYWFVEVRFHAAAASFVQAALSPGTPGEDYGLWLNLRQHDFDLLASSGRRPLLLNTYDAGAPEDILYYTLFAAEQLSVDLRNTPIVLCGDTPHFETLFALLGQYAGRVETARPPAWYAANVIGGRLPYHMYYTVFNLHRCES